MVTRITSGNVLINGKFIQTDIYFEDKSTPIENRKKKEFATYYDYTLSKFNSS